MILFLSVASGIHWGPGKPSLMSKDKLEYDFMLWLCPGTPITLVRWSYRQRKCNRSNIKLHSVLPTVSSSILVDYICEETWWPLMNLYLSFPRMKLDHHS